MQIKFQTNGPLNFGTYSYAVMFNTQGTTPSTPVANGFPTGFTADTFLVAIDGTSGSATLEIYQGLSQGANSAPLFTAVPFVNGNDALFLPNSNGQNTQFTVQFRRSLASAFRPTSSPSASPSTTPTPTPTPTPTGSSSPSPTPTGTATPIPGTASTWYFNYFVVKGPAASVASTIVDSLGNQPAPQTDTNYQSQALDTTVAFDTGLIYPSPSQSHGSNGDPSSIIYAAEITNNP